MVKSIDRVGSTGDNTVVWRVSFLKRRVWAAGEAFRIEIVTKIE